MRSITSALQPATRRLIVTAAFVAAVALAVDEALKMLVRQTMAVCPAHDAAGCDYLNAGGIVGILHVENAGSALGFVQGSSVWVLLAVLGVLLVPLCGRSAGRQSSVVALAAGLMAGGGLSNFFDRLAYGSVTDFLALGETIVINPADVALLAGMVLMTRIIWQARSPSQKKPAVAAPQA